MAGLGVWVLGAGRAAKAVMVVGAGRSIDKDTVTRVGGKGAGVERRMINRGMRGGEPMRKKAAKFTQLFVDFFE